MKYRPIDLRAHEVRGILAGRQTQIRRVMKPQPSKQLLDDYEEFRIKYGINTTDGQMIADCFPLRFGAVGDRLWGREAARVLRVRGSAREIDIEYQADNSVATVSYPSRLAPAPCGMLLSPGTHREASRITLDVVAVRVERLQDISEADAKAEGSPFELGMLEGTIFGAKAKYRSGYCRIWESIHGPERWAANPWVWVIEFKRVEGGAV